MLSRNYNKMNNIYNINNCMGNNPFNCGNMLGSFSTGCNSIFNFGNTYGGMYSGNMFGNSFGNFFTGGFNMYGNMFGNMFTNCNGTPNWDAMAGFGLANLALNFTGMFVGNWLNNRENNSLETIESDIVGFEEQKEDILSGVGKTEDEIMSFDIKTSEEAREYDEAKAAYETNEGTIKAYTDDKTSIEDIIRRYTATNLNTNETKPSAEEYNAAKAKKDAYTKAISDKPGLKTAMETAEREMKALEEKMKDAKSELEDLNEKIANAEIMLDDQIADKVDGNKLTRNSDFTYKKVDSENFTSFKKNDLKNLNFQFTHLDDGKDKFRYAEAIYKLDESKFNDVTNGDENYAQVRKWAVDYYNANKSKYPNV